MIKILYYEPSTGFGGSSRCLYEWLRHLNHDEFMTLIAYHFDGPAIKKIKSLGVRNVKIPYIAILKSLSLSCKGGYVFSYFIFLLEFLFNIIPVTFFLITLVLIKKIDLVDVNTSISTGIPGILAALVTHRPCLCHIHDTRNLTKKEVFFAKFVNTFFILTNKAFEQYHKELPNQKIVVLPNGIDLKEKISESELEKVRDEFGIKNCNAVFGVVGRITQGKGHDDFVKAAKLVISKEPKTKFFIVGSFVVSDQKYENNIKKMVEEEKLEENVIFTGWRNDVKTIMAVFDALIVPTSTFPEGFNLTCIEAMALGKPVIATRVTGPSEIVIDQETGFLVPPSNPRILAEKILDIINNRAIAQKMGFSGRKRIETHFDIEKIIDDLENEYKKLILNQGIKI